MSGLHFVSLERSPTRTKTPRTCHKKRSSRRFGGADGYRGAASVRTLLLSITRHAAIRHEMRESRLPIADLSKEDLRLDAVTLWDCLQRRMHLAFRAYYKLKRLNRCRRLEARSLLSGISRDGRALLCEGLVYDDCRIQFPCCAVISLKCDTSRK
jgi:hypothetical protein